MGYIFVNMQLVAGVGHFKLNSKNYLKPSGCYDFFVENFKKKLERFFQMELKDQVRLKFKFIQPKIY